MSVNKIQLPKGHKWSESESGAAQVTRFECKCGASFEHDMEDGSISFQVVNDGTKCNGRKA